MHFPQKNGDQTWAKNDRKGKKGRSISNCILTLKYIQDDVSLIGRHFTGLGQSTHKGGVRTIFFFMQVDSTDLPAIVRELVYIK